MPYQSEPVDKQTPNSPIPLSRKKKIARWRRYARLAGKISLVFFIVGLSLHYSKPPPGVPPLSLPYAYIESPNADDRPIEIRVDTLVLHATVTQTTDEVVRHFLKPESKVSAHFVVGKQGEVIQMVRIEKRAWHAGVSVLEGREKVNDFSVGIEMVNMNDGVDPFTDAQYLAVAGILRFLRTRHSIPDGRIVTHAQIALPPGRKTDPIGFDVERLRSLAR